MPDQAGLWLCILDSLPSLVFAAGGIYLALAARCAGQRRAVLLIVAGTLLVSAGGILKALSKLLPAISVPLGPAMGDAQFVLMAPGFAALFVAVLFWARSETGAISGAREQGQWAIAVWKIPLLAVMTLSSLLAYSLLSYLALRRSSRLAGVLFVLAALALLGMASMARSEQTTAQQWREIGLNLAGQIAFASGSYALYRDFRRGQAVPDG